MELLVVRHAIAEDREAFAAGGGADADRPLTPRGRRRFERAARALAALAGPVDVLASSELARAVQTAAILADACGARRVLRRPELAPGADPALLLRWLQRRGPRFRVAVVGHEPHLSRLVALLTTGRGRGFLALRKGGACLLELGDRPAAGRARLRWLATPKQLRALAR